MGAEPGAKTREPEVTRLSGMRPKMLLENEKHRGAAHIAMGLKHGAALRQGIPRKGQTDCLDHIAPSGMNEHGSRPRAALLLKEGGDRCRGHVRHRTVEEITQLAAAGLEPEHVAFFRPMERAESVTSQAGRTRPAAPNRGGCTVAEQACAHQHAVVIVEIKRRGADLHRHARHHSLWLRSHQVTGGAQGFKSVRGPSAGTHGR